MNIKDFIKNNKIAVIAGSVVLAVAIASGVAFGVINHKNKVESKGFTPNGSSVSTGSDKSVSLPTDNSSKENTSGEASTGSDSTEAASSETTTSNETGNGSTIEVIPTPSKNSSATISKKPASKPSTSSAQPTTPAASTPSTSTPSNTVSSTPSKGNTGGSTGGNTGGSTGGATTEGDSWHLNITFTCKNCGKEFEAQLENCPHCGAKYDLGNCSHCGRPYGDGYNGTCNGSVYDFPSGKYICKHYD